MNTDWIGLRQSGLAATTGGWISRILRHRTDDPIGPAATEGVVTFYQGETLQIWTLRVVGTMLCQTKKKKRQRLLFFLPIYIVVTYIHNGAFLNIEKILVTYFF